MSVGPHGQGDGVEVLEPPTRIEPTFEWCEVCAAAYDAERRMVNLCHRCWDLTVELPTHHGRSCGDDECRPAYERLKAKLREKYPDEAWG